MRKLTLKWKFFLIINYILLVVILISTLIGIISLVEITSTINEQGLVLLVILIFLLVTLSISLNIYIVHRFFPDTPLSAKSRNKLNLSKGVMIVFTLLVTIVEIASAAALSRPYKRDDFFDISAFIFFGLLMIFSLYTTILQFQIPSYLNNRNAGTINQLIDSIGTS
jgi:hypothetical protein